MTKKHKLEKFLTSILHGHIDTEDSEKLEDREDIDEKLEKILKLVGAEDPELVFLINNFHKGYQTLHGRYDNLIGKLKKNVHHERGDNGNLYFKFRYSDSGSEEFSCKERSDKSRESNAGQLISLEDYQALQGQRESVNIRNNEPETLAVKLAERDAVIMTLQNELQVMRENVKVLQAGNDVLKIELETSFKQQDQRTGIMYEENEALRSENSEALSRIHNADKSKEESKIELDQMKDELWKVKSENSFLKKEMEKSLEHVASLNQQLSTTNEEKEALRSQNYVLSSRIQEAEKALADLQDDNANMSSENKDLKLRLGYADQQGVDLIQRLTTAVEESSYLKSEILRLSSQMQEGEENIKDLSTESGLLKDENLILLDVNNDLCQKMKDKDDENNALTLKHSEAVEAVRQGQENLAKLSAEVGKMKYENSHLLVNYENLKLEIEATNQEVSELRQTLDATQAEKHSLTSENSELLSKIQQAQKIIDDFIADTEQLGIDKSQLEVKINSLSLELQTARLQLTDLNKTHGAADEEKDSLALENSWFISQLQQNAKEIENELERLREENSMLQQDKSRYRGLGRS